MLRSILVGLDGSRGSQVALAWALDLATWHSARLELARAGEEDVLDAPQAEVQTDEPPHLPLPELDMDEEPDEAPPPDAIADPDIAAAIEACRTRGVAWVARRMIGVPADRLAARARAVDLVAVGRRTTPGQPLLTRPGLAVGRLLEGPGRALLTTTEQYREPAGIVAAYDRSEASLRALSWAAETAPLARLPLELTVVASTDWEQAAAEREARAYLRPHHLRDLAVSRLRTFAELAGALALRPPEYLFVLGNTPPGCLARLFRRHPLIPVLSTCRAPIVVVK